MDDRLGSYFIRGKVLMEENINEFDKFLVIRQTTYCITVKRLITYISNI